MEDLGSEKNTIPIESLESREMPGFIRKNEIQQSVALNGDLGLLVPVSVSLKC